MSPPKINVFLSETCLKVKHKIPNIIKLKYRQNSKTISAQDAIKIIILKIVHGI